MEAILYQSGPACRIYLLADGSNCPAEDFLNSVADLQPAELVTAAKWKKAYETAKKANKLKFSE